MNRVPATVLMFLAFALSFHTSDTKAQESNGYITIEAFLDSLPGIHSRNLDLNDFFDESTVTAIVYADENGTAEKVRIRKARIKLSGNSDNKSLNTAKKLLKESSRHIAENRKHSPGKNKYSITWKPRYNKKKNNCDIHCALDSFIMENVTTYINVSTYKLDGSAFIEIEQDSAGYILDTEFIGSIIWNIEYNGNRNGIITGLSVTLDRNIARDHSASRNPTQVFIPRYDKEKDRVMYKIEKILKNNAKSVGNTLIGKKFSELGDSKRHCIEINVSVKRIETGETPPQFPGGADALDEYLKNNIEYSKVLRRNNVKGYIDVEFNISKEGKVNNIHINKKNLSDYLIYREGGDSRRKIEKAAIKAVYKLIEEMPDWIPGTQNGYNKAFNCKLNVELK